MSQLLTLPDELFDRLRRVADQRGLSVEELLAWCTSALEPSTGMHALPAEDEDLLVASTRALLDRSEPPLAADWNELRDALSRSEPPYASVEEAMSALRQRPWTKDEWTVLAIDSDVFLIDCRYPNDTKYALNRQFLDELAARQVERATTVFNLLEVCGVLTFNLNPEQLRAFYANFARHYGVYVLGPQLPDRLGQRMIDLLAGRTLGVILRRVSFGDALAVLTAESNPQVTQFITWNARHFVAKTYLDVKTPRL
jgi:hypothetical protein